MSAIERLPQVQIPAGRHIDPRKVKGAFTHVEAQRFKKLCKSGDEKAVGAMIIKVVARALRAGFHIDYFLADERRRIVA